MNQRIALTVEVEDDVFVDADFVTDENGHVVEVGVRDREGEWYTRTRASGSFATTLAVNTVAESFYGMNPSAFGRRAVPHE